MYLFIFIYAYLCKYSYRRTPTHVHICICCCFNMCIPTLFRCIFTCTLECTHLHWDPKLTHTYTAHGQMCLLSRTNVQKKTYTRINTHKYIHTNTHIHMCKPKHTYA